MCGPKFCSMKTHTHLEDKSHPAVVERAPDQLVRGVAGLRPAGGAGPTGSVAHPPPVLLGRTRGG